MKDLMDTICALSTPPGRSGIAVVRISGPLSFTLLHQIFTAKRQYDVLPARRAMLGRIRNPLSGFEIDEAIAIGFSAPGTYTGEDMVEFSLHGSPVLIAELLDCLHSLGARLAEPGEFTMRAFLRGRLDLTQAEAVNDIIDATTLYQAQVAAKQHKGALAQELKPIKEIIIEIIVNLESAVEFVEENLPLASRDALAQQLGQLQEKLKEWIESYRRGRIIKEGFSLAIIGRPNVGKSSLFNALLAQDRSIVAEMPGTTRDLISEYVNIGGIPVRLQDTAGIQDAYDHIEKQGIDRSFKAIAEADAILLAIDASDAYAEQDYVLRQQLSSFSCMVVMNKVDLARRWSNEEKEKFADGWPVVEVSAKTGLGISDLRNSILSRLLGAGGVQQETIMITNLRHVHNVETAQKHFEQAANALREGMSEEFPLMHLHSGLKKLGEITGETSAEDLLTEIFSRFCIGK
jgi:tRNA modification GTPase